MKEIKLSAGLSMYESRSAFPIGDLELYISNLPMCSGEFRLIAYMNKVKIGDFTLTHGYPRVSIPRSQLAAGVFSCQVIHYQGDTEVRRYRVEDLTITDLDDTLSATPEITDLKAKVEELTESNGKLSLALDKANESLEQSKIDYMADHANMLALVKWAYKANKDIPYFDGAGLDEFLASLGITLSDDEKQTIGGNNDD